MVLVKIDLVLVWKPHLLTFITRRREWVLRKLLCFDEFYFNWSAIFANWNPFKGCFGFFSFPFKISLLHYNVLLNVSFHGRLQRKSLDINGTAVALSRKLPGSGATRRERIVTWAKLGQSQFSWRAGKVGNSSFLNFRALRGCVSTAIVILTEPWNLTLHCNSSFVELLWEKVMQNA